MCVNSLRAVEIPPIKDEYLFEDFCLDYWKHKLNNMDVQKNGRRGQRQQGIDIFGRDGSLQWIGVQCKVKSTGDRLTEKECNEDIKKAFAFNPKLAEYHIVTTAPRDAVLQEYIRKKDDDHINSGLFRVYVRFWDDIKDDLVSDKYKDLYYKYYKDQCIRPEILGNAICKLISLRIGVEDFLDTQYEILLGKLPIGNKNNCSRLDYWRGTYLIMELNRRKADVFGLPCHWTDFEDICVTKRDAYIVSSWINEMGKGIDDVIYAKEEELSKSLSKEEYSKFLSIIKS